MISHEIVERVRTETDIVGLIGEYVTLKRSGRSFTGLCPFHQEKTPSFNVSPERQAYHCFGCGAGGNALTFIMNYENVTFPEAVKKLAERLGIKIEYTAEDDPTKPLSDALEIVHKLYQDTLWSQDGLEAQRYLASRGLKKETIKNFGLGLVPQDVSLLIHRAREAKLSTNTLAEAGVLGTRSGSHYPFLGGRIVFPIRTSSGKLVGFSGRIYGEDSNPAKYVNTPETRLFKKGQLLYGLSEARPYLRRDGALIVEGQMDVLRLSQDGFHNAVAPLGTAFTNDHAKLLTRYADSCILLFDGDEAGRKAALRTLGEVLASDLDTRLVLLPEGEDPASFLSGHQAGELAEIIKNAEEPVGFLYKLLAPEGTGATRRTAELMISIIRRVPDRLRRELYIDEAAKFIGVDRKIIAERISASSPDAHRVSGTRSTRNVTGMGVTGVTGGLRFSESEDVLFRMMVASSEFVRMASEHLPSSLFEEAEKRELLEKLYETAREREQFTPGDILDSLSPEMQRRVSAWSLSELRYSREEFARALAHYIFQRTRDRLRSDLKEAERAGDAERAKSLLGQLNSLVKESNKIYQGI